MGRPEKPVNVSDGPAARFASELRRLREDAGSPTYRDMAHCALYSASVLSSAASGYRLPTLHVTLAYVRSCGGETEEWRRRWLDAQREENGAPGSADERMARPLAASAGLLPRPAQLPLGSRVFSGRSAELRRLADGGPGPVVISGPPGVGKSALALAYARDLAQHTVDGQLYADLSFDARSSADPHAVVDGFLRALGVPAQQLPATADQRTGLYRTLLAQRRVLVLLENACCERQVRPLLAESRLSVTVVVGRAPLLGLSGVRRIRLDVFSRADSAAHIARMLPQRAQQDPGACDQIAALCADLPLALDIALRKLAAHPQLPLRRVADRLRQPHALLDWLRVGDLCLRETLDAVYGQLDDAARTLLHRLVRHGGDYGAPGSGPRAITTPPGEEDQYEQLAESGLIRWGSVAGIYHVDPLTRTYVSDQARRADAMHRRVPAQYALPFHPLHRPAAAGRVLSAD